MKILIVHNHYGQYAVGGEATVVKAEAELLRAHGHDVFVKEVTNAEFETYTPLKKLQAFRDVAWMKSGADLVGRVLDQFRPDIMHVHNYWFLLSPSIFAEAKKRKVATALTLHNYRLVCPGNQLLRNGKVCEDCLTGNPWRVLWHRCYPGKSFLKSALSLRLYLGTRSRSFLSPWVDAYIALTEFGKRKFVEIGIPETKIYVKPNFMNDPCIEPEVNSQPGEYALFVGRISPEKGLPDLMKAWKRIDFPLRIVGDGPQMKAIRRMAPASVVFTGAVTHPEVLEQLSKSSFLVFPSNWYEGFGLTILEAMALGKAVVASDLGPRREIVRDGVTGLLYRSGDVGDLREKIRRLIDDQSLAKSLGERGRAVFLRNYGAEVNYEALFRIYNKVILKQKDSGIAGSDVVDERR